MSAYRFGGEARRLHASARTALAVAVVFAHGCGGLTEESVLAETTARFEERYVTAPDGVRLYVRVTGTGPDTVIIPGAGWLARDFDPLVLGHTLIFFDPRGRGASDAAQDLTTLGIENHVRDIGVIQDHFGLERVSLIGWSFLGAVVALYAAEHPDRVRRIVQVGPMPPTAELARIEGQRGSPPDSADQAFVASMQQRGLPDSDPVGYCREWMMRMMIRPMMGRPEAAARARIDPCLHWNEWPSQLTRMIRYVIPEQWDYRDRAGLVTAPVLTIHGTEDPNAAVEGGRAWVELLPNARLVELEGVGHAPWLEAPEQFFAEVVAFLDGA